MKRSFMARSLVAASIGLLLSTPSWAFELFPGRVRNPAGLQQFQRVVYNPVRDSYLILYAGDLRALIGHLSTDGIFSGETPLSDAIGVTHVNAAFNPDDGTFLVVYRDGDPPEIFGIYITPDGTPIGSSFFIGSGGEPHIDFSPASGRYVVTWEQLGSGAVRYRVIDGDSTSANPPITAAATVGVGLSPGIAYSSGANKFLVVYVREIAGAKANVYGRFISSNGTSVGGEFVVAGGSESQQKPRVAYAPSTNRWMVMFENWAGCGGGCPHLRAGLLSDTGATVKGFNVAATSAWDTPGWITYNSVTDTFIAGWRSAFSDTNIQARAGEFSPVDAKLKGPTVLLTDLNAGVEGAASRPDPMFPQATFLWRDGFGGDGVHAGILNLTPPVPDTTPPGPVTDLAGDPTAGGTPAPATAIASTKPADMTKTTDGNASSYWSSPDRNAITTEFITWDLGSEMDVSQVSLLSRSAGNLFPVDYQIQVSTDNVNFTTVFGMTGASVAAGTWVDHPLPSPSARYVKLLITKTRLSGTGKYKAQVAEVEILEAAAGASVMVHWTAPGDDDDVGTATSYDLRWSPNPITPANFGSATLLPTPDPSTAGAQESALVTGFPSESLVFFALKARDEVPNVSDLSNVASVATLGVPPAPVLGFAASSPTGNSVDLSWQPSGDDGNTGNATSYDIRYSTAPINDSNFGAAASAIVLATNPKPALETHTLPGLANQTTYFFAIKALDDLGNPSLINGGGPVTATTLDALAPAAAGDLSVQVGGGIGQKFNAPAIAASGQSSSTTSAAKATDGNPASYWSTPGRAVQQVEFITLDLGAVRSVGRVTLLSRSSGTLFPEDLEIQVSTDNSVFNTVEGATGLPSTPATLHTFDFGPVNARYVRIRITKTRLSGGGLYYAQIAEIAVFEGLSIRLLTISWTEPGDDGDSGIASSFDLRYSTSSIGGNSAFNSATQIDGEPAPSGAGSTASFVFVAPEEGVTLHFRMKTLDEAGNPSALSNEATADIVIQPPAEVSDLLAFNPTSTSIDLSWTSTGDDGGSGTADAFDIRYSTSLITGGNFGSATPVTGEPAPGAAGSHQQMTVGGLSPSTTYFFAMKVLDETGAASAISNVVSAATDAPDTTAPSNVTDLRGSAPFTVDKLIAPAIGASSSSSSTTSGAKATDGNVSSYWSSAGSTMPTPQWITLDTGASHDIGQVRILSRPSGPLFPQALEIQVSDDNATFATVHTATGLPATAGLWHTFEFPAVSGRYLRVNATTLRATAGGVYYAQMAEIEVYEATFVPGPVALQWTAPGDDGPNGTAASYDVRYSATPINNLTDFNAATAATGEPSPQAAGATESFEVNLAPGTYFFALRTRDEANNPSGLSNVPVIVVP
jgi:hypothetical protein